MAGSRKQKNVRKGKEGKRIMRFAADTHHPSPITHHPLPITHYPLPITHHPLPLTQPLNPPQNLPIHKIWMLIMRTMTRIGNFN